MTNRIDKTFHLLKQKKEKALIIYITGGDPNIKVTLQLLHTLVEAGADMIEIGIPFSDPMGDGKANQKAAERALRHSTHLSDIFHCVSEFRKTNSSTPLILFTYLNPVYAYGYQPFARDCRNHGVDGCLFLDMPYDEEQNLQHHLAQKDIHTIFLVTPTTDPGRLKNISRRVKGFLYAVSSLGVTGVRTSFEKGFHAYLKNIRLHCRQPICVGFGISSPEMAQKAARVSDGIIIGSAVVNRIADNIQNTKVMLSKIRSFVHSVKKKISKANF